MVHSLLIEINVGNAETAAADTFAYKISSSAEIRSGRKLITLTVIHTVTFTALGTEISAGVLYFRKTMTAVFVSVFMHTVTPSSIKFC